MTAFIETASVGRSVRSGRSAVVSAVAPAIFALFYPLFVDGFHWAVGLPGSSVTESRIIVATAMLTLMFAVPLYGFVRIAKAPMAPGVSPAFEIRARRLAYATVVAPTIYCFIGVWKFLLSSPLPDEAAWAIIWGLAIAYTACVPAGGEAGAWRAPSPALRVVHGVTAAILVVFVAFHLTNHMFAWKGQAAHAAVMDVGRMVYRSSFVEPVLVAAMLFQVVTGLMLAWRWSARRLDFHRIFQVASGFFLSVYILGHMNSVFTFARWFYGIPTGWDFATGAPNGLIHDPWSIRLIPHYALAIFLIVGHLFSGLRVVMLAHGAQRMTANRIWGAGIAFAALLSTAIMLAMCGMRI
ncbi:hypothetical protein [Sphingobium sp.]|uniref:hypothetical protein n=1 Tax=Sphingobium sp. TaxID=1912891 RepID=UPI003B3A1DC4